jgi:hypothetical protein
VAGVGFCTISPTERSRHPKGVARQFLQKHLLAGEHTPHTRNPVRAHPHAHRYHAFSIEQREQIQRMVVRGGPGQPIVFTHIPRSAGTSFTAALTAAVQPQAPFPGYDQWALGPFQHYEQLAPDIRRRLVLEPDDIPAQADAVMGLITPSTTRARFSESTQLTVLREPRTRIVSHWLTYRSRTNPELKGWGDVAGYVRLARAPLASLLDDAEAAFYTDNVITRCLIWPHPLTPADDFIDDRHDDELVETVLATLHDFDFAGVIEDPLMPERASHHVGAELRLGRLNEAPLPRRHSTLDIAAECTEAAELLVERSRLDAILWDRVATDTYLPRTAVEQERDSLFRAAIEHYDLSMAEGLKQRRGRSPARPPETQPPVLSHARSG